MINLYLYLDHTHEYYDGVVEFSAIQLETGQRFLATAQGDSTPAENFTATAVTEDEYRLYHDGDADIRTIMLQSGTDVWYQVTIDGTQISAEPIQGNIADSPHLPAPD